MGNALANRAQQGHNSVPVMSTRYAADGRLMVKAEGGKWHAYPAYVAHRFAERLGVALPEGCRVITLDPQRIEPRTLAVKERGKETVALTRWVREAQRG